jgi:hypothetical protein
MGPKDPPYLTPLVKSLLAKRRKLRRCGRSVEASQLADRINQLIADYQSKSLGKLTDATPKQLWAAVKPTRHRSADVGRLLFDVDVVNNFFANIATDLDYSVDNVLQFKRNIGPDHGHYTDQYITCYEVEKLLYTQKSTASGYDPLPSWLLHSCSFELAEPIAHIYNCSKHSGVVPNPWRTAVVTRVPKVSCPASLGDYRPISVTPILSRIADKFVVRRFIGPGIPVDAVLDQFAFKPTCSTTCALACLQHHITQFLETNSYVRCIIIDFSKAFDTIDHAILLSKLSTFSIPINILNWIIDFLTDRQQLCKIDGRLSTPARINRSIIQGSGLGPTLYIGMKSDLTTVSSDNVLIKYADDVDLLVPECSSVDINVEFDHVKAWAVNNKMVINLQKTKELVFHRPNPRNIVYPACVGSIEQVRVAKLLGVYMQCNFCCEEHVKYTLSVCSQRVYLLKLLRDRGLNAPQLHLICQAIIISRFLYALPVWGGYLSADLKNRLNGFLRRLYKYGLTAQKVCIEQLLTTADRSLFHKVMNNEHCLHHLLPPVKCLTMQLRPASHNCELPLCKYELYKRSFIIRCLLNCH